MLTPLQAFNAMQDFLEIYFKKTSSDSLGALLSCMQFLDDEQTADQAIWEDWINFFKDEKQINSLKAFDIMHRFLKRYYKNSSSYTIRSLLNDMQYSSEGDIADQNIKIMWTTCVEKALSDPENSKHYLHLTK